MCQTPNLFPFKPAGRAHQSRSQVIGNLQLARSGSPYSPRMAPTITKLLLETFGVSKSQPVSPRVREGASPGSRGEQRSLGTVMGKRLTAEGVPLTRPSPLGSARGRRERLVLGLLVAGARVLPVRPLLASQSFPQCFDMTSALSGSALIGIGREAQAAATGFIRHLSRKGGALLRDAESHTQRFVDRTFLLGGERLRRVAVAHLAAKSERRRAPHLRQDAATGRTRQRNRIREPTRLSRSHRASERNLDLQSDIVGGGGDGLRRSLASTLRSAPSSPIGV